MDPSRDIELTQEGGERIPDRKAEMRHYFPAGESFVKHNGETCACKPERRVTYKGGIASGRGGRHQGYKKEISWHHNPMPTA